MRPFFQVVGVAIAAFVFTSAAQPVGPYKVIKAARVGGEGGWDYIYADAAARRLYIPSISTHSGWSGKLPVSEAMVPQ